MANSDAAPLTRILGAYVAPVSTVGNDLTTVLGVVPEDMKVTSVTYTPVTTVTGAATNNRTVAVVNKAADGTGTTSIASLNFANGTNATAVIEKTVTLSVTAADLNVTAGDVLVFTSTHIGTGIADPGGHVRVTLVRR